MLALRSLAKSTLGELKDSLLDADTDDEDESPSPCKATEEPAKLLSDASAWPPGYPGTAGASRAYSTEQQEPVPTSRSPVLPDAGGVPEAPAAEQRQPATDAVEHSEPAADSLKLDLHAEPLDPDKQNLLASFSERYDTLLGQYEALQRRYREMSERQESSDVLTQQIDAWRSAHQVAQQRVETLSLDNADLKEKVRMTQKNGMDGDERKKLLQKLQMRDAEVRSAAESIRQLSEVMEDGAGDEKARCIKLELELAAERQAALETQSALAVATAQAREAEAKAEAAEAARAAMAERCRGIEMETAGTAEALEVLLREKERHFEEKPHLVDKRLVTCMLANYQDHLESNQRPLADAVLAQMIQILGGLPDLEARQKIRSTAASKEHLGNAFLEFLDNETADGEVQD